jgi:uncharacterized membrane protein YgaE (UPF0421/DUF939 family)
MNKLHNIYYQAMKQQKISKQGKFLGIMLGLLVSIIIVRQEFFTDFNKIIKEKEKVLVTEDEEYLKFHQIINNPTKKERDYENNFTEISGLAKMLVVTIHAPWIFKNQNCEAIDDSDKNFKISFNQFFSKFSLPLFKGQSKITEPDNVPVS